MKNSRVCVKHFITGNFLACFVTSDWNLVCTFEKFLARLTMFIGQPVANDPNHPDWVPWHMLGADVVIKRKSAEDIYGRHIKNVHYYPRFVTVLRNINECFFRLGFRVLMT